MVQILNGIWMKSGSLTIWNPDTQPIVKNHFKSKQKYPDFEWSGFQIVGTIAIARPFENQTIGNLIFKKSIFECFRISTGPISNSYDVQ